MKTLLLVASLGGILALTLVGAISGFDPSGISVHGWIALGLGTVLSLGLAGGLMALTFYSSKRGFDDRVSPEPPNEEPR